MRCNRDDGLEDNKTIMNGDKLELNHQTGKVSRPDGWRKGGKDG